VNAYEVKAGMVYLQGKKLCDPYLSASGVRFLRWGSIQIFVLFTFKAGKRREWRKSTDDVGLQYSTREHLYLGI